MVFQEIAAFDFAQGRLTAAFNLPAMVVFQTRKQVVTFGLVHSNFGQQQGWGPKGIMITVSGVFLPGFKTRLGKHHLFLPIKFLKPGTVDE